MKALIESILAAGGRITSYNRTTTLFGNEAEIRWRKWHNSKNDSVQVVFSVSDAEHEECKRLSPFSFT